MIGSGVKIVANNNVKYSSILAPLPITFEMPIPPPEIRGNNRSHRMIFHKHFTGYQQIAISRLIEILNQPENVMPKLPWSLPFEKALIVNTFYNNRSIDLDNFAYGMKAVQDALVDREIIIDDNATTIIPLNRYRKCVKTERRVVVWVYNISGYEKVSIFGDSDFLLEL